MRCLFAFLLATTTTGMSLTSCVADNDANEKSISDYSDTDVKSYGDLFQVFWSVMNQRYCTLNEQSSVSSQTWDQVYKEYKPKFDALMTFQHPPLSHSRRFRKTMPRQSSISRKSSIRSSTSISMSRLPCPSPTLLRKR